MHIPDGYLGPQTYVPAYAAIVPLWAVASNKLNKTLRARQVPLLALGAAFCFVIMMFNVPIPGGTTGHATGAVLIAILLGPWAATIAVSLALMVQALLFGDGGITALGANCLNIAVVMPWTGWLAYRLIAGRAPGVSRRQWIAGAVGGYVGLNAAALTTAVMFGIQPLIARGADGLPLYNPFGLSVAVPIMAAGHLLVFGFVEAAVTGLVIAYLQRTDPSLVPGRGQYVERPAEGKNHSRALRRIAIALGVLVVITPIGLYLPEVFGSGSAWGEWSAEEVRGMAGYVPSGLGRLGRLWRAPMPDYALRGQESAGAGALAWPYVVSGVLGAGAVVVVVMGLRRVTAGRGRNAPGSGVDAASKRID